MRLRRLVCGGLFLAATFVSAQSRPLFDPDDFVDPRLHERPLFISRLVAGAVGDFVDDLRATDQDIAFLHLTNSIYWRRYELAYKHSEARAAHGRGPVYVCDCTPPVYFPTPPPADAAPEAPEPGARDTLQFAWYRAGGGGAMLRYRASFSRQPIGTTLISIATRQLDSRVSGREQSFAVDADTHVRVRGHDVWGSLLVAHTARSGTIDDRRQNELLYTNRFPGRAVGPLLLRATLTVGGVSNRGASGINVVNPAFEAFWRERHSRVDLHLVWSPQATRSGAEGWRTTQQIAVFVDRALVVKLFR